MATIMEVYNQAPVKMVFDTLTDMPWVGVYDNTDLNVLYLSHAGSRDVSPLINQLLNNGILDDNARTLIGRLIEINYRQNWTYLWKSLFAEYDPITNYKMVEEETSRNQVNGTTTDNTTTSGSTTDTRNLTTTTEGSGNSQIDNKVYGYDSEMATNDTSSTTNDNNTTTTGDTGTVSSERTDTVNRSEETTNNENGTRSLTRSGNIGVTTSQQMITSEVELRRIKFIDIVMRDIDDLLCSRIISV